MDTFNSEKAKYDKLANERGQLNTQYLDLKDKFQKYAAEIQGNDSKIKAYNAEIETLQNKITATLKEKLATCEAKDEIFEKLSNIDERIESYIQNIDKFKELKESLASK